MIEIASIQNSPVIEVDVSDKLTKDDIQEMDDFFENRVSENETVNILLLMGDWEGLTLKGLLEDFKMVKHMKKMDKAAVVADSNFLKADSKIENLYPGLRVAYFETDEKEAAKKWLEE
ncbi:STAS/SEC14 domain-containing protein [Bacillus piscicola]|uniref:STAS/SEC14 domain-containing protein n=1 Tax=Bacillus piscicola TaxID=1632684 RepID=UPI001F08F0B2|nr:STAS/SEC14 domain-containing protein [Bacillus piscicola]